MIVFTGVVVLCFYIVNRLLTEKRKYENAEYLENLQRCNEFLSQIQSLSDYVTWVQRDQLKSRYHTAGEFFHNKSSYYQNQPIVGQFNEVYENLDRYVVQYNQQYVLAQKEKLKQYFDNIEGKKLDEQQRHALITDEY